MHTLARNCALVLSLMLPASTAFAAVVPQDRSETVTVTGDRAALTADLDPTNDHFDGLTGDKIAHDIDPLDRYDAFRQFAKGLTGPLGETYDWHGLRDDGTFRPTREYTEAGLLCRDFTEETNHRDVESSVPQAGMDDREPIILGTACHERDGWHFR